MSRFIVNDPVGSGLISIPVIQLPPSTRCIRPTADEQSAEASAATWEKLPSWQMEMSEQYLVDVKKPLRRGKPQRPMTDEKSLGGQNRRMEKHYRAVAAQKSMRILRSSAADPHPLGGAGVYIEGVQGYCILKPGEQR